MDISEYNLHAFWWKKKLGLILAAYTVVQAAVGAVIVKAVLNSAIPAAVPIETDQNPGKGSIAS